MADYSEFPTTPTAWQEHVWPEPVTTPDDVPAQPQKPPVDRISLVVGVLFSLFAVAGMSGADLSDDWGWGGHLVWLGLLVGGAALLVAELRRSRRSS